MDIPSIKTGQQLYKQICWRPPQNARNPLGLTPTSLKITDAGHMTMFFLGDDLPACVLLP